MSIQSLLQQLNNRKHIPIIGVSLLLLLWSIMPLSAKGTEIALIMKIRGLVSVKYADSDQSAVVSRGYLIMPGAMLQTGMEGFAVVKYINTGNTVVIRPRSAVVINSFSDSSSSNETVEMRSGEAIFDVSTVKKNINFDLYIPDGLVSLNDAECLCVISGNNAGTALYNLSGSLKITDKNFYAWKSIGRDSVIFVANNGIIQSCALTQKALPRIRNIYRSTLQCKSGPALVHDLTVLSEEGGASEPSGKRIVLNGVDIEIKAMPNEEFTFTGWKILNGNALVKNISGAETKISVISNTIVQAKFAEKPYLLTIDTSMNGTTVPSGDVSVMKGHKCIIRIIPKRGFTFTGWKKKGKIKIVEPVPLETEISLYSKKGKVKPKFERKSYKLTVSAEKGGTASPKKIKKIKHGDSIEISAAPDAENRFLRWDITKGFALIKNPYTPNTSVVCDSMDAVLTAIFSDNAVEVLIPVHDLADISPVGNFFVRRNSVINVRATPAIGHYIKEWTVVRGRARINGLENVEIKCKAPFEIVPVVEKKVYDLEIVSNDMGTVYPSEQLNAVHGEPVQLVAVPNKGKHFIRWRLNGGWAEIPDAFKDSLNVTLTQDAVLLADFAETVCTLTVNATYGGYTEPGGKVRTHEDTDIFLEAVPNPKAAFISWEIEKGEKNILFSDTLTIAEQTVYIKKGNASIKALFSTEAVEITVLSNGLGTTKPEGKVNVVQGKWFEVFAEPNEDQALIQWTTVSGDIIEFKDAFSPETEALAGKEKSVIKAIFGPATSDSDYVEQKDSLEIDMEYQLYIDCDEAKGKINGEKEIKVKSNTKVAIQAEPNNDYNFDKWVEVKGIVDFDNKNDASTSITVREDNSGIEARFEKKLSMPLEIKFTDYEGKTKTIKSSYQ